MKKIIVFLSLCTLVLSSQVVHADAENVTPQNAIAGVVANSSGQPSVEQENSYSATLENVTEENESGSAQLNSTSSTVVSSSSSIDLQVEEEVRSISEEADSSNNASTSNLSDLSAGTSTSSVSDQSTDTSTSSVSVLSTDISTSKLSESSTDEISTSSLTASSTEASIPNPSTRASTKSVISSVTETSSSTSSTQVGTSLRSMPRTTSLSGNLSVSNVNAQSGSFDVHVTNVSAPRGLSKILVPTWTESNGQDDIIYHTADRQSDGSYKVTVPNSKHKYGTGKYYIHLYYRGTDGSMTYVAQTTTTLPELKTSGNVSVSNVNAQSGSFDVHVTNVSAPRGLSKVLVPTWTESNGQDDIIYHTADRQSDGSYKVTVPNSKHKYGTGKYHIHLYYRGTDGSMTYVAQTTTTLPELKTSGNVSVSNVNAQSGSFDVHVTNVSAPRGLSKVLVPTWTESNGQDDIIYHTADRQSDGSFKVTVPKSKHKYGTGKYHIHLYYRGTDGSMTYVAQTTTILPELKTSGNVSVSNVNAQSGSFDVHVTNVSAPRGLSKVLVPTWTESNGQDDIIYHTADRQSDGSYKVTVPNSKHKYGIGKYHIHLYYRGTDGSMTYVAQTTTTLPELKTSGNVSVSNVNAQSGSFDVHVTNVSAPRGLSKVLVPTWTESNGQDDIIYHTADRQSDGSFKVTVPKSKHKYGTGKYHIHLYYRGTDGSMTYVAQTTTNLPQSSAKGTISAELVDATKGTFSVSVSNVVGAEPIKDVEVAVWSEKNNQDDLKSYSANRKSDGTYHVEVAKGLHRNDTGTYHIEVYYRYANTRDLIGSTTVDVPSTRSYTVYIDPGHGGRDSGASYGGIHEKNLAMSVSNKLRDNLLARGINVLMTRTGDTDVDFRTERSRMANESNADLFVSIHFNATGIGVQSTVKGIETYWYQYDPEYQPKINQDKHNDPTRLAESEILAVKVQSNLIKETGATDRGVRRETFAVLRETAIPAILVELGFMDNPSELAVIKEEKYHVKLAKALTQGIMDWYGSVGGK